MIEWANSVKGTKSLKIHYHGGSKSNDNRTAAGVAQVNEGPGKFTVSFDIEKNVAL